MKDLSDTAARLLAVAHPLILARGYNAFSYADLSEKVGIRKASIHHHFPSKADLVTTLLQRYRAGARDMVALGMVNVSDPQAKLAAFAGYWSQCLTSRAEPICLAVLLAAELPSLPAPVAAEVRGHFRDLSGWLQTVFAQMGNAAPADSAETFMATIHGAMLSARAVDDASLFDRIAAQALAHAAG